MAPIYHIEIRNLNYDWQGNIVVEVLHEKLTKELMPVADVKNFALQYKSIEAKGAFVLVGLPPFEEGHVIPINEIHHGKLLLRYRKPDYMPSIVKSEGLNSSQEMDRVPTVESGSR